MRLKAFIYIFLVLSPNIAVAALAQGQSNSTLGSTQKQTREVFANLKFRNLGPSVAGVRVRGSHTASRNPIVVAAPNTSN